MKAAILYETDAPLKVEEVDLEAPQAGEVMVKLEGTGVCHTDLGVVHGHMKAPLPIVLGHEGAGIVREVGTGVTDLAPGDHVVLTGAASCRRCRCCIAGTPAICEFFRPLRFSGFLPGNQSRLSRGGRRLHHFFLQSSFAEYAVVPREAAVKVREDAPLDTIGILGCGVMTGLGSVLNAAEVRAGSSVVVFGCGGVGLSAVMAARLSGAYRIIAVDPLDSKLKVAEELGATATVNPTRNDVVAAVQGMTGGGADYAIVAVGSADAIAAGIDAAREGGKCIVVASPPQGSKLSLEVRPIIAERTIRGCTMGSGRPMLDIPRYVDLFMDGRLPIDRLVTRRYPLSEINRACRALDDGEVIKPVIVFSGGSALSR